MKGEGALRKTVLMFGIILGLVLGLSLVCRPAHADLEWSTGKQLSLEAAPLDVGISADGQWIFILTPGQVLVYSPAEDTVTHRIPVDKAFDRLTLFARDNSLILSSSSEKRIEIIQLEMVQEISTAGLAHKGPQEAPVTIAVFNDYQCPYCSRLLPLLQQVLDKNPDDVKLVFKNFPLAMHKSAKQAAAAALAANEQGKFWEFHETLFENYRTLNDAKIQEIAEGLGLDIEKFNKDTNSQAIQELIVRDMRNGQQAGVRGTPTIFVNGKLLKNRSLQGFQEMIDAELNKGK